jgi:hypothetical protein
MERIAREARESPKVLLDAPHSTPNSRLDEGRAARELKLRWSVPGREAGAGAARSTERQPIARS